MFLYISKKKCSLKCFYMFKLSKLKPELLNLELIYVNFGDYLLKFAMNTCINKS